MATPPDFVAGNVLTAAQMNGIGLWLIKTQTIGSGVSAVTVTDAFSADYDNYRVIVSGGAGSTNLILRMTLGATVTGYYYAGRGFTYAGIASDGNGANVAFIPNGMGAASGLFGISDITSPFLAKETGFASIGVQMQTSGSAIPFNGYLNNTTSYTDFTITASTGTMTGGEIRVYGYRD